jgi:tetratricopeptide (TPR) repeat protein
MFLIILYISFVLIVTVAGEKKEIGAGWAFIISLFLSPLVGMLAVLVSDNVTSSAYLKKQQNRHIEGALNYLKANDFEKALSLINKAIEFNPNSAGKAYYILAQIYSAIGEIAKSYQAIIKSNELGYNVENIEKSELFINLRNDRYFGVFVHNGYKSVGEPVPMDKVSKLMNLAELYKNGMLTEAEFSKAKLELV